MWLWGQTLNKASLPKVDLILLAEDPLVFAGQVGHVQELLWYREEEASVNPDR